MKKTLQKKPCAPTGLAGTTGSVTLTVDQIKELAEMAGLKVEGEITEDDRETEITIESGENGVKDRVEDGGDGVVRYYRHIAYFEEYPEEGVYPLGSPNTIVSQPGGKPYPAVTPPESGAR